MKHSDRRGHTYATAGSSLQAGVTGTNRLLSTGFPALESPLLPA